MFQGLFIDGFAGGGGASTGIAWAIGRDVDHAINHSETAIAIHRANHPGADHHCTDIRIPMLPQMVTKGERVAGAWFSPDCKEFSKAKGGPVKDRSIRALCWEVVAWLKDVRPTVGYLENVEEFEYAAPLDDEGFPIRGQEGREFKRFVKAIRALGYKVAHKILRACDYGAPTSRKRLYMIMRCDGLPIVWPKPTHGRPDSPGVKSGKLLPYRTAAECIDWSIPCPSIFGRKKDLADSTMRRIAHGVMRYVVNAAKPFIVPVTHQGSVRVHDIEDPLRTVTGANRGELSLIDAMLAPHITKFHSNSVGSPMDKEMPTVTANGQPARPAGATPLGRADVVLVPHIMTNRNAQKPFTAADEPTHTITAGGAHQNVVQAALVSYGQHGGKNRPVDEPHHTVAASKKDTNVASFLVKYYATDGENEASQSQPADRPLDTITTKARFAVVTVTIDAVTYIIVDIGLRMLKPRELARAQGFPDSYVLNPECWYTTEKGNRKFGPLPIAMQISAIGNSVCPPVARALVAANQPGLPEMRMVA